MNDATPLTEEQEEAIRQEVGRRVDAATTLAEETVTPIGDPRYRAFVAAQSHANSRFLVVPGVNIKAAVGPGTPVGVIPLSQREGDVWAQFAGGVLVTDDPDVIEWCERHPQICQDANDPRSRGWVDWKRGQTKTASQNPVLDPSYDITVVLFPERSGQDGAQPAIPITAEGVVPPGANHPVDTALVDQRREEQVHEERGDG